MEPDLPAEQPRPIPAKRGWQRAARWIPALLWMGLIFFASAQPRLPHFPGPLLDTLIKKSGHFAGYAVLAVLLWWALQPANRAMLWAWLLAVLYAASDEFHQTFVPGRGPSPRDVLIDACGAAASLLLLRYLLRRRARDSARR